MNSQNILNVFLIILLAIASVSIAYIAYYFVKALKSITNFSDNLNEATEKLKDRVQLKVLTAIPALLVALVGKIIRKRR